MSFPVSRGSNYGVTKVKAMDAMKLSGQKQQIKLTLRDSEPTSKLESKKIFQSLHNIQLTFEK
jgi:hypothetical protein